MPIGALAVMVLAGGGFDWSRLGEPEAEPVTSFLGNFLGLTMILVNPLTCTFIALVVADSSGSNKHGTK